jgi:hypothetical protein
MPARKVPATWKQDERDVAAMFTETLATESEFGHVCTRIPLSGSNNRRTDGSDHHGDISLPDAYDLHVELKRRALFSHQALMDQAKADAAKHGIEHTILITKTKRQKGFTAMMDLRLLMQLLSIPEARNLLKRATDGTPGGQRADDSGSGRTRKARARRSPVNANQDE